MIQEIVHNRGRNLDPEDWLTLASQALRRVDKNLFERFFTVLKRVVRTKWALVLKRRVVLRVPSYNEGVIGHIQAVLRRKI